VLKVRRIDHARRAVLTALTGSLLVACGATSATITPATRVSPTPMPTPTQVTAAPTPVPTSSVPITKLLTKCPARRAYSSLQRFSKVQSARDIDVAQDGSVWVSTGTRGVIAHLSSNGALLASYNEPTPAGLVTLPDGNLLFADQAADRILELNLSTLSVTTFLQLTPLAGQAGVNGLGVDITNALLLVPDSAQGQILSVPLIGGSPAPLATGIVHPVDAAVGPGSVIEVATSSTSGLLAVPSSGGAAKPYSGLPLPLSAVVVKGLLVYVTAPAAHRVYALNPATGHTAVLVTAIDNPQGLALLGDGQLLVSDASTGTLATFRTC
jgi:hypothetical protein